MKLRMCGAVLLCVMMLVGAVACSSGVSKAPNGMTGSEILAMTNNATASINTLRLDSTADANIAGGEIAITISALEDVQDRNMYISMCESMTSPAFTVKIESYILNNWMYMSSPIATTKWAKTQLTEDIWNEWVKDYGANTELRWLQDFVDAEYVGIETINGTSCYKINVKPNVDALSSAFSTALNTTGNLSGNIKSSSCTAWIDENTSYPVKVSGDMTMEMSDQTQKMELSEHIVVFISNINQPVTVVLPVEAQNATVVSYSTLKSGQW